MHGLLFGDGDFGSIIESLTRVAWVLIPLAGIVWFILRGLAEEKTKRHDREMLHRERVAAFEKGMTEALERSIATLPPEKPANPNGLLIGGIITIGVGVGLLAFFAIAMHDQNDQPKGIAAALIPLFIGLSLVAAWFVLRRLKNGNGENPKSGY